MDIYGESCGNYLENALKTLPFNVSEDAYYQLQKCIEEIKTSHNVPQEAVPSTSHAAIQNLDNVHQLQLNLFPLIQNWDRVTNENFNSPPPIQKSKLQELNEKELEGVREANLNFSKKITEEKSLDAIENCDNEMVIIGPNGTTVSRKDPDRINWNLPGTTFTRKLLLNIFGHKTLAFSTLSGKSRKDFGYERSLGRTELDPLKVADITIFLQKKLNMTETEIRRVISKKCEYECKKYCVLQLEETKNFDANPDIFSFHKDFGFGKSRNSEMVIIGPNGTEVSRNLLSKIDWNLPASRITRKLVLKFFGRKTLAESSLSGARYNNVTKAKLDPLKVAAITLFLNKIVNIPEQLARNIISSMCRMKELL